MVVSRKKTSRLKRAAVIVGLGAAVVAGSVGLVSLKRQVDFNRVSTRNAAVIFGERLPVKNPVLWGKLSAIYGYDPAATFVQRKIILVEKISNQTGISPAKLLFALERSKVKRLNDCKAKIKKLEIELFSLNKNPKRNAAAIVDKTEALNVLHAFEQYGLSDSIIQDVSNARSSMSLIKGIVEAEKESKN